MAPHSSTLAWKIPWTEKPSRLQSMGSLESDTTERLHFYFSLSCIGEGMATHSSVLAWRIPGMGKPGGLLSMGLHRVGHDWSDLAAAAVKAMVFPVVMYECESWTIKKAECRRIDATKMMKAKETLLNCGVALALVLPKNTQDWSPLEWTGWISLQSKGLPRVFSNTTVQKHQFFGAQPSSQSNSHIHTWPQEKP